MKHISKRGESDDGEPRGRERTENNGEKREKKRGRERTENNGEKREKKIMTVNIII